MSKYALSRLDVPPAHVSARAVRKAWLVRFGLPVTRKRMHFLSDAVCEQLAKCAGDPERRILLGIGRGAVLHGHPEAQAYKR